MTDALPILMYHQVTPRPAPGFEKYAITPEAFAAQMDHLRRAGYESVTIPELRRRRVAGEPSLGRVVAITFDDGFRDCVDHAVPILQSRSLTATFFLVAGLGGKTSEWLRVERSLDLPLMDWDSARRLESSGFSCGAHGWTHARLTALSPSACREELRASRSRLEDELGPEVRDMAYPHGCYDQATQALVAENGFESACSVRPGLSGRDDDPLALHRVHVEGRDSLATFRNRIRSGRPPAPPFVQRVRGVLRRLAKSAVDA